MNRLVRLHNSQKGFTIIEVMIATLVFSVVLIICLQGVTQIGKLYYKGVSTSQTQELIRNLSADLTQQIQFGSEDPTPFTSTTGGSPLVFCVGDYRYRAVMNRPLGDNGVDSVLKRKQYSGGACDRTDANFDNSVELASKGMRIQGIDVADLGQGLWSVDVKVALGADDLFEFPSGDQQDPLIFGQARCRTGLAGSEFCATAELSTTVIRRIR